MDEEPVLKTGRSEIWLASSILAPAADGRMAEW